MLEPKKTLVGLAGQNAWHICAGDALPRIKRKYRPSQLRTQKAGPEPANVDRGGGAGCGLVPNGSAKNDEAWCCSVFCKPPNRKSNRPSAETALGESATGTAMAATSVKRRRLRWTGNWLRNAYPTRLEPHIPETIRVPSSDSP
jgi:hypothetical protein